MTVTIQIPDSLVACWQEDAGNLARTVLEDFAVGSYRQGKLSPAQVREMLGHGSRWETEAFLSRHEAWPGTSVEDLDAGLANLQNMPLPSRV